MIYDCTPEMSTTPLFTRRCFRRAKTSCQYKQAAPMIPVWNGRAGDLANSGDRLDFSEPERR